MTASGHDSADAGEAFFNEGTLRCAWVFDDYAGRWSYTADNAQPAVSG